MPKLPPVPEYISRDFRKHMLQDKGSMTYSIAKDDIGELSLFLNVLDDFIEQEEKRQVAELGKQAKPDDGEFWATYYPYQWQDVIGNRLRESFIVSLIALCEFHVGVICRDVAIVTNAKITHEDLKGGIFLRARKFLETFADFKSPSPAEWEAITDFYTLRNSIVHNASLVDYGRNSERLQAFIKRTPGISNPSIGMLVIKIEFCVYALGKVDAVIDALKKQYVDLCTRLECSEG